MIDRLREWVHHADEIVRWRCRKARPLTAQSDVWHESLKPILWAHAGGGRLHAYGNSREAIDDSIAQGYPVIEVDVSLTADRVPVLSHRFRPCGQNPYGEGVPTVERFLHTPIDGRYAPLTFEQFVARYQSFAGFFAIDAFSLTKDHPECDFPSYLERTCSRAFLKRLVYLITGPDCAERLSAGHPFAALHYAVPEWLFFGAGAFCCGAYMRFLASHGIQSASLEVPERMRRDFPRFSHRIHRIVREMQRWGVHASVFGVETVEAINNWREVGVEIFNVDHVLPRELKS